MDRGIRQPEELHGDAMVKVISKRRSALFPEDFARRSPKGLKLDRITRAGVRDPLALV